MNRTQKKDDTYEHVVKLLQLIYEDYLDDDMQQRFIRLIDGVSIAPRHHEVNQKDAILIAFGDHIRQTGRHPLAVLDEFCNEHFKDMINTVHILPHFPYTSDRGFSVSDYLKVNTELGDWQDISTFGGHFRLMFDAVFNHVSASHTWFKGFLDDNPRYRDYFIELDKDTDVSEVTRPRTTPLLTAFPSKRGERHVWTTFSADQVDLNFANPAVLYDILQVLLAYVGHGADLIRLDAIAFSWKELGTNSIHRPKAHAIIKVMREVLRLTAPWVQIITETNVPHNENISYFGNGHDEAHMVYNFALPPLVVHSLQTGNASGLTGWAKSLRTPSDETYFFNFTASHDGIGVRGVTGILTTGEIERMCKEVLRRGGRLSLKTNPDGTQGVYEMNISYFDAVSDPDADLATNVDRFICSQAIALSLKGVPGIYLHSLVGSVNWLEGVERTGHSRTINEEKLQLEVLEAELLDKSNRRHRVLKQYSQLLKARSNEPAFNPLAEQKILDFGPGMFAVERSVASSRILALHNVTGKTASLDTGIVGTDIVDGRNIDRTVTIRPYGVAWLRQE